MKKKLKNTPNNFLFANEMNLAKKQFIQIIQEMPDDEFIDFIDFISIDDEDGDFDYDDDLPF